MAKDEEFRKVAEDIRTLARSLAKDFRDAADQGRVAGRPTGHALREGLKGVADEARRGVMSGTRRPYGFGWCCGPWSRRYWSPRPPSQGSSGATPGAPGGGGPQWMGPWAGPPWQHHHQHRSSLPPVRRRWDASTVLGMLAVLFGVAWVLGAANLVHVSAEAVAALALMLLGASLVVTGRTDWSLSRRHWPVWVGAGLILVLISTSSTFGFGAALSDLRFGDMSANPSASGPVHGGFGNLTVDATQLEAGTKLDIQSVAGNIVVTTPSNAQVTLDAHVFAGEICVDGKWAANGLGQSKNETYGTGAPVNINVHEAFGEILIGPQGSQGCKH